MGHVDPFRAASSYISAIDRLTLHSSITRLEERFRSGRLASPSGNVALKPVLKPTASDGRTLSPVFAGRYISYQKTQKQQ